MQVHCMIDRILIHDPHVDSLPFPHLQRTGIVKILPGGHKRVIVYEPTVET